jgi:hypothetical protein
MKQLRGSATRFRKGGRLYRWTSGKVGNAPAAVQQELDKQKALTGKPNGESATALAGTGAAANANAAASDATKKSRRSRD